jgi:hypothetical protein
MTPNRVTRAYFDEPFYDLSQGLWGGWRWYDQIAPIAAAEKGADSSQCQNMHFWASGAWTLRPLQMEMGKFGETNPGVTGALGSSDCATISTSPTAWQPGTTYGLTDLFFRKSSADVTVTPTSLSPTAKITALPAALGTMTVAMDPILKTNATVPINQGICIRFCIDGLNRGGYDWIGAVAFGQYALGIRGDGWAELWEYGTPRGGGSAAWGKHTSFRYSKPNQVTRNYHQIIIYPHVGPTGEKYIAFASANLDSPQQGSAGFASSPGVRTTAGSLVSSEYLFRWDEIRSPIQDQSGGIGNVTTSDRLWILERRNVRGQWQLSRLVFAASGTLLSDFWGTEPADARPATLNRIAVLPASTTLTSTLKNGAGGTVTLSSPGDAFNVEWAFGGPKTTSPILWGYKVQREMVSTLRTPTAFDIPGTRWQVNQSAEDPRGVSASFLCEDLLGAYPRLKLRGELPVRIVVTDSSGETPFSVTLHQGVAISPLRTKMGRAGKKPGMSGMYGSATNHTAEWSQYQITAAGMWHRLSAISLRSALNFQDFAFDATVGLSATGQIQGWKITDAIKRLLTAAGFPSGMQRIPDLAQRFHPGIGTQDSDRILEPSTSIAETVVRLCRNYLGRFLVFDPNSGTNGQWTLVGAPSSTTALANFVGGPTWEPGDPLVNGACLSAYPAGTLPVFGHPESYYIAPENNHVVALTVVDGTGTGGYRIDNHVYNYLSYKVPGSSIDPDPDSPHYLGYEKAVILADPTLWAGAAIGGWDATQKAVDFVLFRVFAYSCMARERATFKAPLIFVTDPVTTRKRPLHFYDVVTYFGQTGWFVRSCNPNYSRDRQQTADYVLERLVPYQP